MRNLNLRQKVTPLRTDLPRIREGKLGGAVWYVPFEEEKEMFEATY